MIGDSFDFHWDFEDCFNPFHATVLFLYSLETSENQRFFDISRRYRKRLVA